MSMEAQKSHRWSDKPLAEVRQLNTSAKIRCPHPCACVGVWPEAQILLIGITAAGPKDGTSLGGLHVSLVAAKLQTWPWPRPQADYQGTKRENRYLRPPSWLVVGICAKLKINVKLWAASAVLQTVVVMESEGPLTPITDLQV